MSIGFEPEDFRLHKLRERLQPMSDEELIRFGKTLRGLCRNPRLSGTGDNPFEIQLEEAIKEWPHEVSETHPMK